MIAVTKEEKEKIAERFPNVHIVRTMKKDSKRHHYYMEENRKAIRFLNHIRREARTTEERSSVFSKHKSRKFIPHTALN